MSNTVKLKRSAVASKVPATTDLQLGELALNTYDGNLFFKKSVSGTESIVSAATVDGTQTLTNKTLTSPTINYGTWANPTLTGTINFNNAYQFPTSDGTEGQVLTTNGAGQLIFGTIGEGGGVVVGGYNNSSLNGFPTGDYGDLTTTAIDAFGISLSPTFSCMDPIGSLQSTDLGLVA